MDYKKIGEFIASERKKKNLTQAKLAKELFVSEKTISKWENGKGLPDTNLLIKICEIFEITLNELLSGQRLEVKEYKEKAEGNLASLVAQRKDSVQRLVISILAAAMGIISLVICTLLASLSGFKSWQSVCFEILGIIMFVLGIMIACILDRGIGCYECKYCHSEFVPSAKAYILSAHTLTARRLRCPNCGKKSYCKKKLTRK